MKNVIFSVFTCLVYTVSAQEIRSMGEVESRQEASMSAVVGKNVDGVYRYYAKGSSVPFTGILFAKYENGQYSSWQEYVDGIGEGKWINYYENGNFKEVGHYRQNKVEGPIKKYYVDGTIKAEGTYKDWRIKIGKWYYYNPSGGLIRTVDYGTKGSIEEVNAYFERGEISRTWYRSILSNNGFEVE